MDIQRLFEAARCGNVEVLRKSLQENSLILTEVVLTTSSKDTLLHVATKAKQLSFVRELLEQMPDLAHELDKDGYRPMDIAAVVGNVEIVAELNKNNRGTCRLKGKDQRTPLHHAAIHGRIEVINELVSKSPESLEDVTAYNETVLHLAVKNHQVDAFDVLVELLKSFNKEKVINWCATNGNTVLHLAISRKQKESVELLLGNFGALEVNAINSKGLTAMDILDIVMEDVNDVQLKKILEHAGAKGAQEISTMKPASTSNEAKEKYQTPHEEHSRDNFESVLKYFKFQKHRDSAGDARNALLVIAALIVSVTFQAGLQLPTSLEQLEQKDSSSTTSSNSGDPPATVVKYSYSSLASTTSLAPSESRNPAIVGLSLAQLSISEVTIFLIGNSLALSWGILIIEYLTEGFPFRRELVGSVYALMITYGFAVGSNDKPTTAIKFTLLTTSLALPSIIRYGPFCGRKLINKLKRSSSATQASQPLPISRG
ncbi:Ankyrin repeat family protein [Tripterygium wilfordii]|uniref:Ankyrin repeat family protein n=1 Tax=Tripterygium wilfordii TaxID=458696 RepID=A0A7J7DD45_TRIWF|nr:ankyrin repeat-containing protein BDA1-like [Tripterygium wilfordii]KAF5744262.1 Ankyrin repeat family protein [Tripterygium wilfordii]